MLAGLIFLALMMKPQPVEPPPLVNLQPVVKPKQYRYQDWVASDYGDYLLASTSNGDGSVFGVICGETCNFFINFQIDCDKGDAYPALVNGETFSANLNLKCAHVDDVRIMLVNERDFPIDLLESNSTIGFAVPLAGGRFQVSRFSSKGGLDAANAIAATARSRRQDDGKQLRSFTI